MFSSVTNSNVSLVLDPETSEGTNPYVADVTVKDTRGNMVFGSIPVTINSLIQ